MWVKDQGSLGEPPPLPIYGLSLLNVTFLPKGRPLLSFILTKTLHHRGNNEGASLSSHPPPSFPDLFCLFLVTSMLISEAFFSLRPRGLAYEEIWFYYSNN